MYSEILNIIVIVIFASFILWFKFYVPGYLKKRGENAATKQDIKEITDRIESVKSDYSKKLEKLRSELQIGTLQRSIVNEKGYEVLVGFFETTLLLKEKFNQNLGDLGLITGTLKDYALYQTSVEDLFTKLSIDYHKLILYHIDKPEIVNAANDIIIFSDPLKTSFKLHFGSVKIGFAKEREAYNNLNKQLYKQAVEENNSTAKKYYNDLNPALKDFNKAFNKYLETLNEYISHFGKDVKLDLFKTDYS